MNIEIIILSEVSQRKIKITDKLYVESKKKNGTNELIDKIKRVTDLENKFMVSRGWERKGKLEDWDWVTTYKVGNNKDLLSSMGNSTQYCVMVYIGKESKK